MLVVMEHVLRVVMADVASDVVADVKGRVTKLVREVALSIATILVGQAALEATWAKQLVVQEVVAMKAATDVLQHV